MRLKGKTALISGAGRNNGKAIALTFAREGANLVLVAQQRGEQLKQVAQECEKLGVKTMHVLADMTAPDQVNQTVKNALERFGQIEVLVNTIGIRPHKRFWEFSDEEWQQSIASNLYPTFYLARALAPSMMKTKRGSIVALGGKASLTATLDSSAVVTPKHGLYGLIKSIAVDMGEFNVRANLIALMSIENERLNPEWFPTTGGEPDTPEVIKGIPLGRRGTPQEVANLALFLASDESSYITGDRVICGGGRYT